ncbi:hypothetical protein A8F94_02405 [Bacillus sp. FJAT-27225]|nr:hypothetical protein A8F94_02405 [Bacillus sp. FJAT-27225]
MIPIRRKEVSANDISFGWLTIKEYCQWEAKQKSAPGFPCRPWNEYRGNGFEKDSFPERTPKNPEYCQEVFTSLEEYYGLGRIFI